MLKEVIRRDFARKKVESFVIVLLPIDNKIRSLVVISHVILL